VKIVHVGPSVLPIRFQFGGAIQRRILELSRNQAAFGHQVVVYSADVRPGTELWHGVEIRNIVCRQPVLALRDLEYLTGLVKVLEREPVDVLHSHGLPEVSLLASKIPATKVLSYDHFIFRRGRRTPLFWLYRCALRKFDRLLPVSEYCLRESLAYWQLSAFRASVLYNGVNLKQFFPDAAAKARQRQVHGLQGKRVILYVGRVCKQKGTDILIESFHLLRRRVSDVALVVAGPAEHFENGEGSWLTREISRVGGSYFGAVPDSELASIYNLGDIFVMPTRQWEMFGMAALEAQACGLPVVASQHGGLPEVIADDSGLFFSAGSSAALADKLETLLTDRVLLQGKSKAARENAQRFGWPTIARQLQKIYQPPSAQEPWKHGP